MTVRNIYGEVNQHEIWMCECTDGKFYLDALQDYKVVHWNYPEITPTQEQIEKAKEIIKNKKEAYRNMITVHDIGHKVKTPYGIGILVDVNRGGGFWVEPLNPDEEWEDNDFDGRQLERID